MYVNNNITVLLMNWNVITYSQNICLSLQHKCGFAWVTHNIQLL